MIAEAVRAWRFLSRPFRRDYWIGTRPSTPSSSKLLFVSLDQVSRSEMQSLARTWPTHRFLSISRSELYPPTWEHEQQQSVSLEVYRMLSFLVRTILLFPKLVLGQVGWSSHMIEADELARAYQAMANGRDFVYLSGLENRVSSTMRALGRFLRGLENHRYTVWLIVRNQRACLIPAHLSTPETPLSGAELLQVARSHQSSTTEKPSPKRPKKHSNAIRFMTYNIHSCIGLDGRLSVERITQVLHRYQPDFVALQELDVGCRQTRDQNQLAELQRLWPSQGSFFPLVEKGGGKYGIGFLTNLEVVSQKVLQLPRAGQVTPQETRGLMEIRVRHSGRELVIFNTHLGLTQKERRIQMDGLIQQVMPERDATILLGDLNCHPRSAEYQSLCSILQPASDQPLKTWFSTFPVRYLDYAFCSKQIRPICTFAPRDSITQEASDHLPLITDVVLNQLR